MIQDRFSSLVLRLASVRANLDRETAKAIQNEVRLMRMKALLLRLQLEIRRLVSPTPKFEVQTQVAALSGAHGRLSGKYPAREFAKRRS